MASIFQKALSYRVILRFFTQHLVFSNQRVFSEMYSAQLARSEETKNNKNIIIINKKKQRK